MACDRPSCSGLSLTGCAANTIHFFAWFVRHCGLHATVMATPPSIVAWKFTARSIGTLVVACKALNVARWIDLLVALGVCVPAARASSLRSPPECWAALCVFAPESTPAVARSGLHNITTNQIVMAGALLHLHHNNWHFDIYLCHNTCLH